MFLRAFNKWQYLLVLMLNCIFLLCKYVFPWHLRLDALNPLSAFHSEAKSIIGQHSGKRERVFLRLHLLPRCVTIKYLSGGLRVALFAALLFMNYSRHREAFLMKLPCLCKGGRCCCLYGKLRHRDFKFLKNMNQRSSPWQDLGRWLYWVERIVIRL